MVGERRPFYVLVELGCLGRQSSERGRDCVELDLFDLWSGPGRILVYHVIRAEEP